MATNIELRGARELRSVLKRTEPEADQHLKEELKTIGARVALVGAAKAPRRTGALQRSIRPYVTTRGIAIGSNLPYAGVVHWGGTIRPRGAPIQFRRRPFLEDAVEDVADWALTEVAGAFDRAVNQAGWESGRI